MDHEETDLSPVSLTLLEIGVIKIDQGTLIRAFHISLTESHDFHGCTIIGDNNSGPNSSLEARARRPLIVLASTGS